jgi:hypothetical protein
MEKHQQFLTTFGGVAHIDGFTIKPAMIGDGRELQLTTASQLVCQPVFAGMSVEAVNNAVRGLTEGIHVPIYSPGLVAMYGPLKSNATFLYVPRIGAVDEKRDFDWSDRRDGAYRNVHLVSSRGARCRLQLTGQWLNAILPAHVGHYVLVVGAALRDDGTGCATLAFDRHALNAGIKPTIHRSLAKPEWY